MKKNYFCQKKQLFFESQGSDVIYGNEERKKQMESKKRMPADMSACPYFL
jgi:hypothetical protein